MKENFNMEKVLKYKFYAVVLVFIVSAYISLCNIFLLSNYNFVKKLPFPKLNLGLDLVGGLHLTLEPDIYLYLKNKYDDIAKDLEKEDLIKNEKISNEGIFVLKNIKIDLEKINKINPYIIYDEKNNLLKYDKQTIDSIKNDVISSGINIIRNRVDALGTKEINLYRESGDLIVLQIPNEQSSDEVKQLISSSAKLTFNIVNKYNPYTDNPLNVFDSNYKAVKVKSKVTTEKPLYQIVQKEPSVLGSDLSDARITFDNISAAIAITFNSKGAKDFAKATSLNSGSQLAIVIDDEVVSSPRINEPIMSGRAVISGSFTPEELKTLTISLKSGALPTKFNVVDEKLIDASLGAHSIKTSGISMAIGFSLVLLFMVIIYKKLGIIAIFGLLTNAFLTISVFAAFGITITLASMAGLLLTIAMAVDANVLIYEKIREFDKKSLLQTSLIENGFNGAMSAIIDSNFTTIISATMLLFFGTIFVKGFAISLIIGIVLSFFTAVSLTKILAKYLVQKKYNLI